MKKSAFTAIVAFFLFSCNNSDTTKSNETAVAATTDTVPAAQDTLPTKLDTVTTLKDQQDSLVVFKSPNGKTYKTMLIQGDEDSVVSSKSGLHCDNDNFSGTDRKAAKISISGAAIENMSFTEFLNGLVTDDIMMDKGISTNATSNRVKEEKRNVKLTNVFLYAIKRESDNDYHVIVGNEAGTKFFNIENSGLPKSNASSFQKLKSVRKAIEDYFGELCSTKYQ